MKKHEAVLLLLFFIAPIWAVESDSPSFSEQEASHEHVVEIPTITEGDAATEDNVFDVACLICTIQDQPSGMGLLPWFGVQPCPTICCGICVALYFVTIYLMAKRNDVEVTPFF